MREEIVLIYKFDELEEAVKSRLIEKCDLTFCYEDEARLYLEDKEEALSSLFDGVRIEYSGFWSQGDGASFTCKGVNFNKLIKADDIRNNIKHCKKLSDTAIYNLLSDCIGVIKRHNNRYSHKYSVTPYVEYNGYYSRIGQLLEGYLENYLEEYQQDEADKIYSHLEALYYEETSEENCIDYLRQFEYFADGTHYV